MTASSRSSSGGWPASGRSTAPGGVSPGRLSRAMDLLPQGLPPAAEESGHATGGPPQVPRDLEHVPLAAMVENYRLALVFRKPVQSLRQLQHVFLPGSLVAGPGSARVRENVETDRRALE